jgi:hypothetical protein
MDKEVYLVEKEIETYLFEQSTALGYAPSEEELDVITTLVFDYMVDLLDIEVEWDENADA